MNNSIKEFRGEYRWMSNFWPAEVVFEGDFYPSTENAYQAAKSTDPAHRKYCQTCTAGESKKAGRNCTMRPDWESVKLGIMEELVQQKMIREPLASKLVATGDVDIYEGNTWGDTFWGVDIRNGKGENHLGKIIMSIRNKIRKYQELL